MADEQKTTSEKADKTAKPETSSAKKNDTSSIVTINKRTTVDLSKELPAYSNGYLKAYAATMNGRDCFAMEVDKMYSPRLDACENYKQIANSSLATLMDYGLGYTTDQVPSGYYIVYQNNLGERIYKEDDTIALSWKADHVLQRIVNPIVSALKDLQTRDIVHGNIRASNLYNGGTNNFDTVKLGDCLSTPGLLTQPTVYTTIEKGMADPIGRGVPTVGDDLYALGVLMAMHLRSYDPLKGKTDNEIISAKVVNGSYAALVGGNDRFSGGVLELLRGLLIDDDKQRWNLDEVMAWMDGRRLSPKQPVKKKKAARALVFNGTSYYYSSTLAHNLSQDPQEAVSITESHELMHWVERSLDNEEMAVRLEKAIKNAADGGLGVGHWDRLIPRVSIALDTNAPIRHKGASFFVDGIGDSLAQAFVSRGETTTYTSFISETLSVFWITTMADLNMDISVLSSQIDKCRQFLKMNSILSGVERCLYFLNHSIHCLSPLVSVYYVHSPAEYLAALNNYAERNGDALPERIIDKHAACYLAARDPRLIEPYGYDLNSGEYYRYLLANIQVMAAIQKYSNVGSVPHVTRWLIKYINPLAERFHSKKLRKQIKSELEAVRSSGEIKDILDIIENSKRIQDDQFEFRQALKEYRGLDIEIAQLDAKLKKPQFNAEKSGREWAMTISGIISTLIILGFIMVNFSTGGGGLF